MQPLKLRTEILQEFLHCSPLSIKSLIETFPANEPASVRGRVCELLKEGKVFKLGVGEYELTEQGVKEVTETLPKEPIKKSPKVINEPIKLIDSSAKTKIESKHFSKTATDSVINLPKTETKPELSNELSRLDIDIFNEMDDIEEAMRQRVILDKGLKLSVLSRLGKAYGGKVEILINEIKKDLEA